MLWKRLRLSLIAATILIPTALFADTAQPDYYPWSYSSLVRAARHDEHLVIYSNLRSQPLRDGLLASFHKLYPFIHVTDVDGDGASLSLRFARETAAQRPSADLVLSSAMDLQEKLINDGYAQPYASPEVAFLPSWAHWKDLGYGTTYEPVVFVYNKRFIPKNEMANTHAAFEKLLKDHMQEFQGRVATYDPHQSAVGMLFLLQDTHATRDAWNLFKLFGDVQARTYNTSLAMMQHLSKGEQWIAYNVIGSYARELQRENPDLEIVYPADYVLTMSRVAFISARAAHPAAAKLFLDFLLSRTGQSYLIHYGMGSLRTDVNSMAGHPMSRAQAIRIGPGLLAGLDSIVRAQFFRRWEEVNIPPANPATLDGLE
ncbi:MAG TPA: ABC transporter substrate-binding protein [Rhizomicrobium sp.]